MSPKANLQQPLAVVGMACRLPGADGLDAYWELLKEGRSGLSQFPPERVNPDLYFDPTPGKFCKTYTQAGGFVPPRPVDQDILPIDPERLRQYDKAHQTMCEIAAQACIDAGYDPLNLPHSRTAVYIGNSSGGSDLIYELMMTDYAAAAAGFLENIPDFNNLPVENQAYIQERLIESIRREHTRRQDSPVRDTTAGVAATMISSLFNLTGPTAVCDAACASATIGLELAAQALFHNRAEMAIVGGCSFRKWYEMVVIAQAATLSTQGVSCPFDASADGLVAADAYAAVIVKTLDRALAEGDEIKAVIRNTALSSDGRGKSFWAPRKEGQILAIQRGYTSGIDPNRLQYMETHATSTQIGDETEVQSLIESIGDRVHHRLPIASVKANIGHSLETAGLSSLIKTILAIQNQTIPPAVNCQQVSPKIKWDEIPFSVQQQAEPWEEQPDGSPRMAGVDAFGIGGVNTHVIVEEYRTGTEYNWNSEVSDKTEKEPIAIVGRGALFAGGYSVKGFADVIKSHASQIAPIPEHRKLRGQSSKYNEAGFLADYEFDWKRHKVPPKLLKQANPLQFALLDAAQQALEEAGYEEQDFDRQEVITVVGSIFNNDYDLDVYWGLFYPELCQKLTPTLKELGLDEQQVADFLENFKQQVINLKPEMLDDTGSASASTLSTRIAKNFDLMGGAFSLDAGEASSQAALLAAVDLLRSGKCERVVVGGAQRWIETSQNVDTSQIPLGEGTGVIVLQRLSDAEAQQRTIFGLITDVEVVRTDVEPDEELTTNNSLTRQIGNTLGASGMATLLYSTLSDTPVQEIKTVNRRGYYEEQPACWTTHYARYEQINSPSQETISEPVEMNGHDPAETPSINGLAPHFSTFVQFMMIQTGCPINVIQPKAYLEGDLRLTAAAKRSVLQELFIRMNHHLEPVMLYTCAQKLETVNDVWNYLEELEERPYENLLPGLIPTTPTPANQETPVSDAVAQPVNYGDVIIQENESITETAPPANSTLRLLERTRPAALSSSDDSVPTFSGATIVVGSGKTTDLLVEKMAEAGNVVYRLESGQSSATWMSQWEKIESQTPVLQLILTEGIAERPEGNNWSAEINAISELINFTSHWLNHRQTQGNLSGATLALLLHMGADFGQGGQFPSIPSILLSSFTETLLPHAVAGLRLKVIDLFEREPAPMIVKEVMQEFGSQDRETHVAFLRGGRSIRSTTVQIIPEMRDEIEVWFPHGAFNENLLEFLPLAHHAGPNTQPQGLWLGLEQINDYTDLSTLLDEMQTILSENPTLRKVVILLPVEGNNFIRLLAARTLFAYCQLFATSNPQLTVSLIQFDIGLPNLSELLVSDANQAHSEIVQLTLNESGAYTEQYQDALLSYEYQVLETLTRPTATRSELNEGICSIQYDPRVDPFLRGHLHEEIPLLPAVMGIETCAEAASAVSGGQPAVGIRNLELVNGFRMASPKPHHAVVEVSPTDQPGILHCELKGEFYDKAGRLKDSRRLFHRVQVLTGENNRVALPPFSGDVPQDDWMAVQYSDNSQERIEGHSGPVWYGPELRTLKSVRYLLEASDIWGCFTAPDSSELAGQRTGSRWQTPAAVLDGTLYLFEFLFSRLTGTSQLPHFIGQLDFGRLPVPGEQLIAYGQYLRREDRHLLVEFDVWGADGTAIYSCRDCKMVDLNITVGGTK
ncbi:Phthiocerol synthesis polyketide synthase type I PpsC [Polystyrenella longa]|uniref:Phthiocerol synthesis polyketide synthase type I PpsC n=1 Tax=Polystyrenella longa TaxID=2528007 RepID=A0A518CQ13_9PLAN|nr:beta-ketoacyl synthase N-terminal-like domain-containing protein [Polystyrenella longa]QDU81274.1 Phthiocerol synthesis polyketide synthase type I PpsC [Polystyrenella longa]